MKNELTVVCCYFNPGNFRSHAQRHQTFATHMQQSGVRLVTVECVFPVRRNTFHEFQVTSATNPDHVQVRSRTPLWLKENLLNLGWARCITPYVMWSDTDLQFSPGWATQTVALLKHHQAVTPFSLLLLEHQSGYPEFQLYHTMSPRRVPLIPHLKRLGECNGGAWAFHRTDISRVGLFDEHILGDGDDVLTFSIQGHIIDAVRKGMHPNTIQSLLGWAQKVQGWTASTVPLTARHHWHGAIANRGYNDRWKILVEERFDPCTDLVRNDDGVWECRKQRINTRIAAYFRARQEDTP
jgi:hypothetical protein